MHKDLIQGMTEAFQSPKKRVSCRVLSGQAACPPWACWAPKVSSGALGGGGGGEGGSCQMVTRSRDPIHA